MGIGSLGAADFQDHAIVVEKELLITDPQVVDSDYARYPGAWSFGYLMEEAFGREQAPEQVAQWLENWTSGTWMIEGNPLKTDERAQLREKIIQVWQKKDGYRAEAGTAWSPQMVHAPFRLLAIVNRMDLALPTVKRIDDPRSLPRSYGGNVDPFARQNGEGRLVFCLVDEEDRVVKKGLTLILEYGLDGATDEARLDWAMAWHALGKHANFDQEYRDALRQVTRCFTDRCHEAKSVDDVKEVKSVIDHIMDRRARDRMPLLRIRSNDGVGGAQREFREFAFEKNTLVPQLLLTSPKEEFFDRKSAENRHLVKWLEDEKAQALTEWREQIRLNRDPAHPPVMRSVTLPDTILVQRKSVKTHGFISVAAEENTHWDGRGMNDEILRREISVQSCCGCHCGDTNTSFYHVAPRDAGEAAQLSTFLRTDGRSWSLTDPASKHRLRSSEMEDRKEFFANLLDPSMSAGKKKKLRELRVH